MKLSPFQEVIERIEDETVDLDRTVARASRAWLKAATSPDQDMLIDSAALNLQAFYTGLERIFQQAIRSIDGDTPTGDAWHVQLLAQMTRDVPARRPAILSHETVLGLDEFRRFRHIVRNVYATNLNPEKMKNLFALLPVLWPQVRAELLAFADFLRLLDDKTV